MAYVVEIMPRASRDLEDIFHRINAESSVAAEEWFTGLEQCITSLSGQPNRGARIRKWTGVRKLYYGHGPHIYCVLYRVLEKQERVQVLHIRHGARRPPKSSDFK